MNVNKAKIVQIIAAIVGLALAALCGYIFCLRMQELGFDLLVAVVVYISSLILMSMLCDLLHELAHYIVGSLCKMCSEMPKYKVFGSSSVEVNPCGADKLRERMIATTAAGLVVTLIMFILGVCALSIGAVHPILISVLPYAAYSLILNAIPVEYGYGKTDGLVLKELIKCDDSARVMLAILKVQGLINEGTSLEDLDKSLLFDLPQLPEDDINFIVLTQLRYEYFKALGNEEEAAQYLERYEEIKTYLPEGYEDK